MEMFHSTKYMKVLTSENVKRMCCSLRFFLLMAIVSKKSFQTGGEM